MSSKILEVHSGKELSVMKINASFENLSVSDRWKITVDFIFYRLPLPLYELQIEISCY